MTLFTTDCISQYNDLLGVLAQEAKTRRSGEADEVVRVCSPECEQQVVGADLSDRARRARPVHGDVAPLVELERFDRVVVRRGHSCLGSVGHHPLLEDAEAPRVVEVEHRRSRTVGGEDVSDCRIGSVRLRVQDEVHVANSGGICRSCWRKECASTDLDGLDHGKASVTGRFRVSLRDQCDPTRRGIRRALGCRVEVEGEGRVEELQFWLEPLLTSVDSVASVVASQAN